MSNSEKFLEFRAGPSVTPDQAAKLIDMVWGELQADDAFKKVHPELAASKNPFQLEPPAGQFGVAETIIVAVAGGLAKDALAGAWKEFIWPALKRKFGKDITES